jgi:dCTP deaminase
MMLSDGAIHAAILSGDVRISPEVPPEHIRPVGIRLHLGTDILVPVPSTYEIDPMGTDVPEYEPHDLRGDGFRLESRTFVLGSTREAIQVVPSLVCRLDGRSTLARLGLMIHSTSSVIDNNTDDQRVIVLELYNLGASPLRLRAGLPIGMLTFFRLAEAISQPSASQYAGQSGVKVPDLDFHRTGNHLLEGLR